MARRVVDQEENIQQKESIAVEIEAKYLLKLREIDALREELKAADLKLQDSLAVAVNF
jgi:hypothetical protein